MAELDQSVLVSTIENLNQTIQSMQKQHAEEVKRLEIIIKGLNETIDVLKKKIYGSSSEKSSGEQLSGQLDLFNELGIYLEELEQTVIQDVKGHTRTRKPKAVREEILRDLPVVEIVHELEGEERNCPYCNTPMTELGREVVREELKVIPAKLQRVQHIRVIYSCGQCREDDTPTIIKVAVPPGLMKHSLASSSAVAYIMTQKYAYAQPLYRQEKSWEQLGVKLSRATQANWINYCAMEYLQPVYDRLHGILLQRGAIHADETPCQVLKEEGKKPQTKSYMWLYRSGEDGQAPIILYDYQPTRGGYHAEEFLKGFEGYLHCDGFSGYNRLKNVTRCGCWAHLRRYFYDAIPGGSESMTSPASRGYNFCTDLFHIEKQLKELSPEERYSKRLELEPPVLKAFWSWLETLDPLGGSRLAKAVTYAKNQKQYMENYLLDGRCSISNNAAERSIRPYTVGRKNFLFHDTTKGAQASAIIYSLVECAKANNLNISKYLETLLEHRLDYQNEPANLENLMPWSEMIQKECKGPQ